MTQPEAGNRLTTGETALVHELRQLLDSNCEEIFPKQTLTSIGLIAQKLAASHDSLEDLDTLEAVTATLSKITDTQSVVSVQNLTVLRGIFRGDSHVVLFFYRHVLIYILMEYHDEQ